MKSFFKNWGASVCAVVLAVVIITCMLVNFCKDSEDDALKGLMAYNDQMLEGAVFAISREVAALEAQVEAEARIFSLAQDMSESDIMEELAAFPRSPNMLSAIALLYDGTYYTGNYRKKFIDLEKYHLDLHKTRTYSTPVRYSTALESHVVDLVTPLYIGGKKVGVFIAVFDSNGLRDVLLTNFDMKGSAVALFSIDGNVMARKSSDAVLTPSSVNVFEDWSQDGVAFLSGTPQDIKNDMIMGESGRAVYVSGGEKKYISYAPVGYHDWYVASASTDDTLRQLTVSSQVRSNRLAVKVLLILLVLGAAIIVDHKNNIKVIFNLKSSYDIALTKSSDLFYEANMRDDTFRDCSQNRDEKVWGKLPKTYSDVLEQVSGICAPEHRAEYLEAFLPHNINVKVKEGVSSINFEYKIAPDENTVRWLSATLVPVIENGKLPAKLICVEKDITERKLKQEMLRNRACVDEKTGVYNKITATQSVSAFLSSDGAKGKHAFFLVEIDDFALIRSTLGDDFADEALYRAGNVLIKTFRKNDVVGRVDEDKFAVLLKNYNNTELIMSKATEVLDSFRKQYPHGVVIKDKQKLSASIGISIFQRDGRDYPDLLKSAQEALKTSKRNGKDRYTFYDA